MKRILRKENTQEIAGKIIDKAFSQKIEEATVITLSGELGAGKTTLTKEIAKLLGVKESIISPTFVIMKIYKTKNNNFKKLIHIDAYRLESAEELLKIGWSEIIQNKENLIVIEWPELVSGCLIDDVYSIKLEHKDKDTRFITF